MRTVQTIGRHPGCDLVLDSPMVSRRHAELVREGDGFRLRDLDSANGVFLHGRRVHEAPLEPGQEVYVGNCRLVFDGQALAERDDQGGLRVDAVDVVYTPPGSPRPILNGIRLSVQPGEFVALVGTSGAGKSTLLSCMLGLRRPSEGRILFNGMDAAESLELFRSLIGFVPQDDIVHRDLPVEDALRYAALMRLPADTDAAEIERRIDFALATMQVGHRRSNPIRTLSGGERKRVGMAAELLTEPGVLFLDEPTSGLDPGMEKRAMELLARLARQGRTVVLITHATQNILLCDRVAFLAPGGRLVFYGPPRQALEFFGVEDFADIYLAVGDVDSGLEWERRFRERHPAGPAPEAQRPSAAASRESPGHALAAGARQLQVLMSRYARLLRADRQNLALLLGQAPLIGFILAFLFQPDLFGLSQEFGPRGLFPIQDGQTMLFLLMASCLMFGVVNSCREVVKELPIYRRERLANLQLVPYLLSKVLLLGSVAAAQSAILLAAVSWRVPLLVGAEGYVQVWGFLFAACLGGVLMGLLLSSLTASAEQAMSLVSVILILQLVLSGAFIRPDGMPLPIMLASVLAVSRWSFAGLGELLNLNSRWQELGLGYSSTDFFLTTSEVWSVLAPLLALHFVLAAAALRWRESRS